MSNVLIINAHHQYPFSKGELNRSLVLLAKRLLEAKEHTVKVVDVDSGWDVEEELKNHQWADIILLQSPINWMGVPWTFKKYMDEVYTAGMDGTLCSGDGRTREQPLSNYGAGGTLVGKKYMVSLTFNAPMEAFDDSNEYLFQGKSVDDLIFPIHMNFRFFAMEAMETFACFDVMKNAAIESDFKRFEDHLHKHF